MYNFVHCTLTLFDSDKGSAIPFRSYFPPNILESTHTMFLWLNHKPNGTEFRQKGVKILTYFSTGGLDRPVFLNLTLA